MYVLCRLMMMFPATAVDRRPNLKWSWDLTEGNGWRILLATALLPGLIFGLIGAVLGLALFSQDPVVIDVVIQPVSVIGMVWGIAILSYSYLYLVDHRENVVGGTQMT